MISIGSSDSERLLKNFTNFEIQFRLIFFGPNQNWMYLCSAVFHVRQKLILFGSNLVFSLKFKNFYSRAWFEISWIFHISLSGIIFSLRVTFSTVLMKKGLELVRTNINPIQAVLLNGKVFGLRIGLWTATDSMF